MTWLKQLWRRRQMERQLESELRFHVEQHTADLVARGLDPHEARRQAQLVLGGTEQVKEACRDARGTRWLEDLGQDLHYAFRTLRQKPAFATVALLTLAFGSGATTVMFTVVNGVLLKPLPYPQPDRLVQLQEKTDWSTQWGNLWAFSYPNFVDARNLCRSADMAAWRYGGGTVTKPGEADYLDGFQISSNIFSVLRVPLLRGRAFLPEEDRPGASPVAIISYDLWQRRFAGSSSAIGLPITFDGKRYIVVGITPTRFRLGGEEVDIFTPLSQNTEPIMRSREAHPLRVIARLRSGVSLTQAQTELELIGHHLAEQYPKSNKGRTFSAEPLRPDVADVRSTLWLLLGAVSLLLLIACVNVASLLLARAVSRERELGLRAALGAGRLRLIRQCLTESALLGISGGLLGILLATVGIRPFVTFWPGTLPRAEEVRLDWHVLAFALAVSLLCGLLFGLAPALRAPALQFEAVLRAGSRTLPGSSRRLHSGFVISEIALAVVLLVCAGMLGRTLLRLSELDPGVNVRNVLTARIALSPDTLTNPARTRAAWDDVLDRVRHVPGVQSISMIDTVPMREGNNPIGYSTSAALPPASEQPLVLANSVTPDYLHVMQIPLRQGRFFSSHDRIGSESVVVVDEVMAKQAFPGRDPLGEHLWIGLDGDPVTVVGVVGHVRYWGLGGDDQAQIRAQLYYPFAQVPDHYVRRWSELMSVAVRTRIPPLQLVEPLRRAVRGATGDQVMYEVNTMEQLARSSLARQRFLMLLFGIFAGLALLLACIGIYGVLAYLTSQRVPEFGTRMALGATARDVLTLVLRSSFGMIFVGVATGVCAALAAGRLLQRTVEGMQSPEISTVALTVFILIAAALLASFIPARRAARIDPIKALREE